MGAGPDYCERRGGPGPTVVSGNKGISQPVSVSNEGENDRDASPEEGRAVAGGDNANLKIQGGRQVGARQDQKPAASAPAADSPRSAAASGSEAVQVRTLADMQKAKSPFLLPPGSDPKDRYSPADSVRLEAVPPWRQASFFGIRERGLFFVYVVDSSGSMIDEARMPRDDGAAAKRHGPATAAAIRGDLL